MESVRQMIRGQVLGLVGRKEGDPALDLDRPAGDPGLFGPGSAAWKVHADFTSMMVGGVAALLLQMLHPAALAGVWDHSNFREDMAGRLRRTAGFIAGTTFGGRTQAERLIERVRGIHDRVTGTLVDGTPYRATDSALLTWVHVAEVSMFLAAYLRYRDPGFPAAMQDRYFAETAEVARRLGATDIPLSRREIASYLEELRPALRSDERTREMRECLLRSKPPSALAAPFQAVTMDAAVDLLPGWAADLHGLRLSLPRRQIARVGVQTAGRSIRWAMTDGSAKRAARRVAAA